MRWRNDGRSLRRLRWIAAAMVLGMLPPSVAAQRDDPGGDHGDDLPNRFEFRLGGQLFSSFTSEIRLDSQTQGLGTSIRLEDDVNLEERVRVARADGLYHFNARHHIAFAAYDIDRTGTRSIARDIRFGDEVFTLSTSVSTVFEERIAKVAYGFNALTRPRGALGVSVGLHVMKIAAGLDVAGVPLAYDASTTAPLPVLGLRGSYRFAERWRLRGAVEWFDVQAGDFDGVFSDVILTVEHDTFDRYGFGIGINTNGLEIESGDEGFRGAIDLSFRAAIVYFKGSVGRVSR